MTTNELWELDATELAARIARGELSALEAVEAAIARIDALEPKVHALASRDFEAARARARLAPTGPFGGVPFLVKDLLGYPGMRHASGSRLFASLVATEPTPYSEALDAAGLIVLGKTTTSELGLLGSTETLLEGVTHNPWDRSRSACGSSGGSAAAVACRMVPMAHASDGGGSIRLPAAMNGVFGLKPSGGRMRPSAPADMFGLVVDHAVTVSVRDSAQLLALTERPDGELAPVGHVTGPSRERLTIGIYERTLLGAEPGEESRKALEATAGLCRDLGHEVVVVEPPPIDGHVVGEVFFTLAGHFLAQLAEMLAPMLGGPPGPDHLEPFTLAVLAAYRDKPAGAMERALAELERLAKTMQGYLARVDVTLCPTSPIEGMPLGHLAPTLDAELLMQRTAELAGYTAIHNMAKAPAMSLPLFQTAEGMPLGSHFAAARGEDARLLHLAYELEAARPWRGRVA
ncbi:MAG: amidase, partial [Myxococcales bacterium]|nr:amidase [Myxococcales bacterium]